jgi:hypothetical protein
MFLTPSFLIPASLIVFAEAALLVAMFYALKGKIAVPVEGPASFLWKLEYEQKIARILFPLTLVVSLVINVSALHAYVKYSNENLADKELSEALKPVLAKAVSIKREQVCTLNGFIAGPDTLERDKVACGQIGDFRVYNPSFDRTSVYVFKVKSETEVVQVLRNGYESISIIDGETTVDQLKTAFSVK